MTDRDKKDILQVLRDLLKHRTDDLGSYEFVLESWIEDAAAEIERLRLTADERAAINSLISEERRRGAYVWAEILRKLLDRNA
jgi:hypothetical protein